MHILSEAQEFQELRFRNGERALYKTLNQASGIKYPLNTEPLTPAHKVFLILQVRAHCFSQCSNTNEISMNLAC